MKTIKISQLQSQFRERLLSLQKQKGLKNNEIAAITGRSEGTVSDVLRNTKSFSDTLIHSMYNKLNDYMQEGDTLTSLRQYSVMTTIAQKGKEAADMRLIVGNTGLGKSIVFKKFSADNKACYYFKVDRQYSWNKFLAEVNRVMGIMPEKSTTNSLLENIVRKVEEEAGENPKLIIDEAEILSRCVWKNLKNLYTATEGLLSIDIVGITDVKHKVAKLAGLEVVRYNENENQASYVEYFKPRSEENNIFTTFARRIKVFHITSPLECDIEHFCRARGIVNEAVIKLACVRWWNYDMADNTIKAIKKAGFDLATLTVDEFSLF